MPLQAMQLMEILIQNHIRMKSVFGFWGKEIIFRKIKKGV